MIKPFLISLLIFLCFTIFETAILSNLIFLPAVPDLLLLCLIYVSLNNGRLFGVSSGFVSGLMLDFLSISPFGLHCLLRTLLGYITGVFNKSLNINGIFLPALFGFCATLIKAFLILCISFFFPLSVHTYSIVSKAFLFELAANTVLTPVVFKFMSFFEKVILVEPENVA